jgi:nitroreductase
MELSTAMRTTAAVRSFTSEQVGDEVVRELLEDARFAPSGGNRQPWRVVLVRDRRLRQQLQELYQLSWREYVAHVASGLVPFAPGEDGRWAGPAVDLEAARATPVPDELGDHLAEVPVLLVVLAHLPSLAVTDNGLDRQSIVGGASVYPFVQNLLLAARARGLGGVMTTVLCRQEPAVRTLLDVPPSLALAGLVLLGHPERQVSRLRRRPVDEFCFVDSVGGPPLG